MAETIPRTQPDIAQASPYVENLYQAIATNDLGAGYKPGEHTVFKGRYLPSEGFDTKKIVSHEDLQPGSVHDVDKAQEMALAAKPGIDRVLGAVALRDYDLSHISATMTLPGGRTAYLTSPEGAHLVTKAANEDRDGKSKPTIFSYDDLLKTTQEANLAAHDAGIAYDKTKAESLTPSERIEKLRNEELQRLLDNPAELRDEVVKTRANFLINRLEKMRERYDAEPSAPNERNFKAFQKEAQGFNLLLDFANTWQTERLSGQTRADFATYMAGRLANANAELERAVDASGGRLTGNTTETINFDRINSAYQAGWSNNGYSLMSRLQIKASQTVQSNLNSVR